MLITCFMWRDKSSCPLETPPFLTPPKPPSSGRGRRRINKDLTPSPEKGRPRVPSGSLSPTWAMRSGQRLPCRAMSELSDEPSSEQIRRARAKKSATGFLAALARHAQQFGDPVSLMIDDDDDQNPGSVQGAHHPASHPEGSPKPSPEACPKTARKAPVGTVVPSRLDHVKWIIWYLRNDNNSLKKRIKVMQDRSIFRSNSCIVISGNEDHAHNRIHLPHKCICETTHSNWIASHIMWVRLALAHVQGKYEKEKIKSDSEIIHWILNELGQYTQLQVKTLLTCD